MSVVVERELDFLGENGRAPAFARILTPMDEGTNWSCAFELDWPGHTHRVAIAGEDAWQALHLAMHVVPSAIFATEDFKAGRIGLWGGTLDTYEDICQLFDVKPVEGPKQ